MKRIETAKARRIIETYERKYATEGKKGFRIYKGFTDCRYSENTYYLTFCCLDGFATSNPFGEIFREAKTLNGLLEQL